MTQAKWPPGNPARFTVRGVNTFEGCRSGVIISREQPPAEEIEALTRAFTLTDPEPLLPLGTVIAQENKSNHMRWLGGYVLQTRARRMQDGTVQPVEVQVHPDPRCQRVLEQIREAEIMQTADRVRSIFNEREIVLMNELVLDFTYDRIVSHRELVQGGSRLERALQRASDAMPISYGELTRCFDNLWPTKDAAAAEFREKGVETLIIYYWGKHTLLQATYRRLGQRGSACKALIRAGVADPRAALEAVVGPVTEFTIIAAPEPALAATSLRSELIIDGLMVRITQDGRRWAGPLDRVTTGIIEDEGEAPTVLPLTFFPLHSGSAPPPPMYATS